MSGSELAAAGPPIAAFIAHFTAGTGEADGGESVLGRRAAKPDAGATGSTGSDVPAAMARRPPTTRRPTITDW